MKDPIDFSFLNGILEDLVKDQEESAESKWLISKFIEANPETKEDQFVIRTGGVVEWICKHGVGHPITGDLHGCDGCCRKKILLT